MVLALVLCTLFITVGIIAVVGFRSSADAMAELDTQHYLLAITEVRNEVSRTLESIILVTRELKAIIHRQLVPREDTQRLGLILAERLRQQPEVDEICYTRMPQGDYVSVHRTLPGNVIIRYALPGVPGRQASEIVASTGTRTVFDDAAWKTPYDPRERTWFQNIRKGKGKLVWVEPFRALGRPVYRLGVGVSIFEKEDHLCGVLMVDSSPEDLKEQLSLLLPVHRRLLFVLTHDNWLISQDSTIPNIPADFLRQSALHVITQNRRLSPEALFHISSMTFDGQRFEVAFTEIYLEGGLRCGVGLVIPEEAFHKLAKANLHSTVFAGFCALLMAAGISMWVSSRLTFPLTQLSTTLERMAAFDIPMTPSLRSRVWEMAVVSDAVDRLKVALQSFGRYVPLSVVRELIATNRAASRGGEECMITVLFSGLEPSRSNENVRALFQTLQEYFGIATKIVEKEGSIDKYLGSGVLALFNEPRPVLHHAHAACIAALQWSKEWKQTQQGMPTSAEIRFGINTGVALVGNIGTEERFAYTAMGDTVNLARRLLDLAVSLDLFIVVGENTRTQISTPLEWRFLGSHQVPGRFREIRVWELLGEVSMVASNLLEARDEFEQGLTEWDQENRGKAHLHFLRALELRPSDRLTLSYLNRPQP